MKNIYFKFRKIFTQDVFYIHLKAYVIIPIGMKFLS